MTATVTPLRILGIDPGGTTGLCSYVDGEWVSSQRSATEAAAYIRSWMAAQWSSTTYVVAERFVPSARTLSFQPDALEIIGYTKYLCLDEGLPFYIQTPAAAKGLATNELLKTIGAYQPKTPHGMDAARHVVLYLHKHFPEILRTLRQTGAQDA